MGIPRIHSPTPLFLFQKFNDHKKEPEIIYPFFKQDGLGTPLFRKGRTCISYILSIVAKDKNKHRNEVIIPAYNCRSLAFSTIFSGLKIRLIDINQNTFFPSYEGYRRTINEKTLAAILPYNWGIFPDLEEIAKIHNLLLENDIFWVDDFATSIPQNMYIDYFKNNSPCLFFSFGKSKIMTIMDGGFAFFPAHHLYFDFFEKKIKEDKFAEKKLGFKLVDISKTLSNFLYHIYTNRFGFSLLTFLGLTRRDRHPTNMQIHMDPLSLGWKETLGDIMDKHFDDTLNRRLDVFQKYHDIFEKYTCDKIYLFPTTKSNVGCRFPLLFDNKKVRDRAVKLFYKNNIGASIGHETWLGGIDILKPYLSEYRDNEFPESCKFQDRLLLLPAHSKVREDDVIVISKIIDSLYS